MIKKVLECVIKIGLLILVCLNIFACTKSVQAISVLVRNDYGWYAVNSSTTRNYLRLATLLEESEVNELKQKTANFEKEGKDEENKEEKNEQEQNVEKQEQQVTNTPNEQENNEQNNNTQASNNNEQEMDQNTNTESNNNTQNSSNTTTKKDNNINQPQEVTTSTQPINNTSTKQKSSNANLKELKLDIEGLTPEFNSRVTEYYLVVDMDVKEIKVTATAAHNKAEVKVIGNKDLKKGKNTVTIEVKAEDGGIKKYYIYVTKTDNVERANASLRLLEIKDYNLSPKFNANILNYNLNLKQGTTAIEVVATPENDKATVKIEGENNLQEGENIVEITITAEDKTTQRVYRVNAYVLQNTVEIQEENKTPIIIALAIIGAFIVGIISFLLYKKNRHLS